MSNLTVSSGAGPIGINFMDTQTDTQQQDSGSSNGASAPLPAADGSTLSPPRNEVTMFGVNYDGALTGGDDEYYEGTAHSEDCPTCRGSGQYDDATPCPDCDGDGSQPW